MNPLRFGLLLLLFVRGPAIFATLWRRFKGQPLRVGEHTIEFSVKRGKHRRVQGVSLGVRLPDRVRFSIHPETGFDRFCKAIGLAEEWQTKDAGFDRDVFILCDDPAFLRTLSRSEPLRRAVLDLVGETNGGTLHCSHGQLWVELNSASSKDLTDQAIALEAALRAVAALMRVRDEIRAISSGEWHEDRDPAMTRRSMLLLFSLAIGVLGAVLALFFNEAKIRPWQMVLDAITDRSVWVVSILGLALITLTVILLRATSRLHWVLLDVLLVGVPGIYLTAHAAFTWQNRHFDKGAAVEHLVMVNGKRVVEGRKRGRTYYITVQGWPDSRAGRTIKVDEGLYQSLNPPACLRARWHPGALGDPWVSQMVPHRGDCEWTVEK